jgi:hypothetical protein
MNGLKRFNAAKRTSVGHAATAVAYWILGIRALLRREIDIYRLQDWTLEIKTGRHRA